MKPKKEACHHQLPILHLNDKSNPCTKEGRDQLKISTTNRLV